MKKRFLFLNSFILKVTALICMTVDHIGVLTSSSDSILRIIGRIALPLFIFMAVEGAIKTHNSKKYILRMGITALTVSIALVYLAYFSGWGDSFAYSCGNIFIDLLLVVLMIRILESKNKKLYPLILLILGYSILCYTIVKLEGCGCRGYYVWLPAPIRMQYGFYSIILGLGFYFAKPLANLFLTKFANKINAPTDLYLDDFNVRLATNIISIFFLIVSTVIFLAFNLGFGEAYVIFLGNTQAYALLSGVFILFYNGKRGYNAKWFQYFTYAYYPLHILILGAIFML